MKNIRLRRARLLRLLVFIQDDVPLYVVHAFPDRIKGYVNKHMITATPPEPTRGVLGGKR